MTNVKVYRILEYSGPQDWVEATLNHSIQGTRLIANRKGEPCEITGITLGSFAELQEALELLRSKSCKRTE